MCIVLDNCDYRFSVRPVRVVDKNGRFMTYRSERLYRCRFCFRLKED